MEILINGEARDVPDGQTIKELLESMRLEPSRVAVEYDGRISPRSEWAGAVLHPGARLEIVHFVGGG